MKANILVIDDDPLLLVLAEKALGKAGHTVAGVAEPAQALQLLDAQSFDLVITDIVMPKLSGIKVLEMVKALDETIEVILITGAEEARFENAIAALRLGASDFLLKPLHNMDELLLAVEKALERRKLALTVRQLTESLQHMRHTDFLTGVFTRRYFFERLSVELMRTRRYQKPISCLLVDIDHLGQINSSCGIACGDQVLAQVARLLTETTRATDIVGRYGGEEFIVALPETNRESAQATAEKLRKRIDDYKFRFGGKEVTVTVSIGVASSAEAISISDLVRQASASLEAAKRAGRNRVGVEVAP